MHLTTPSHNVTIHNAASQVSFSCEMSEYILPDEDLQWTGNHGTALQNSHKYSIVYKSGRPLAAQRGGNTRLSSRISTLTIYSPTKYDSGQFTCFLRGTAQFILMELTVEAPGKFFKVEVNTIPMLFFKNPTDTNNITYATINGCLQKTSIDTCTSLLIYMLIIILT